MPDGVNDETDFSCFNNCEPIEDSGAMISTGGIVELMTLCEYMNLPFDMTDRRIGQAKYHHFGPKSAGANMQVFIGNCKIPLPTLEGNNLLVSFGVLHGSSPVIIGRDIPHNKKLRLITCAYKNTWKLTINGRRNTILTYADKTIGNLRRVRVRYNIQGAEVQRSFLTCMKEISGKEMIKRIHERTHASAVDIRRLMQRTGNWTKDLSKELKKVKEGCIICAKTEEPRRSTKFSIRNIDAKFNQIIAVDFFQFKKRWFFHVMCEGTGYSEVEAANSRNLQEATDKLDIIWLSRHGNPESIRYDAEFGKNPFKSLLIRSNIRLLPPPARRHNKNGKIERKHRTIRWIIKKSCFLTNIFYGSKLVSAFELARGYTPKLLGKGGISNLPKGIIEAYLDSQATRKLQKVLSSNHTTKIVPNCIRVGDRILGYIRNSLDKFGAWKEYTIHGIPEDRLSVIVKPGAHILRLAPEDIRVMPQNETAVRAYRQQYGMRKNKKSQITHKTPFHEQNIHEDEWSDESDDRSSDSDSDGHDVNGNDQDSAELDNPRNDQSTETLCPKTTIRRSTRVRRRPERLIEQTHIGEGMKITSQKEMWYSYINQRYGSKQFTRWEASDVPGWLFDIALQEELQNWKGIVRDVPKGDIPSKANIISSHTVYRLKRTDEGDFRFKARICPHGNKDREKDSVRKDSEVATPSSYRMILAIAALYNLTLFKIDIKAAFLQSGPIGRQIYVTPPSDSGIRECVWLLLVTACGIGEAGRVWQLASDEVLTNPKKMNMESIPSMKQLFT